MFSKADGAKLLDSLILKLDPKAFYWNDFLNFSDFSSLVVYSDQLFGAAHYTLNILSRYSGWEPLTWRDKGKLKTSQLLKFALI